MSGEPQNPVLEWIRSTIGVPKGTSEERHREWQRADEHLARVWGIEVCDMCGRTILLGEDVSRFSNGDLVVRVCPICEAGAVSKVYRRAA